MRKYLAQGHGGKLLLLLLWCTDWMLWLFHPLFDYFAVVTDICPYVFVMYTKKWRVVKCRFSSGEK